jgi:hypothetical protein
LIGTLIAVIIVILLYLAFGKHMHGFPKKGIVHNAPEGFIYSGYSEVDSNGIHLATGLKYGPGMHSIQQHCLACHSSKLITQNRATREGWSETIRWMQRTQGLWDLGKDEIVVLDYLEKYYAPESQGRRANLVPDDIEWYELKPDPGDLMSN